MSKVVHLLIFLAADWCFEVTALRCYTCSTFEAEVCKLEQESEENLECGARSTCVTMTYQQFSNGKKTKRFFKKCGDHDSKRCEDNCQYVQHLVPNSCKTSCCSSNLCNEEVNEKIIWYALIGTPNSSRRITQENYFIWIVTLSFFVF